MFKIDVIAVGKMKKGAWADLVADYASRMKWPVHLIEVESKITDSKAQQAQEQKLILEKLDTNSYLIIMDERGDNLRSLDFAHRLEKIRDLGHEKLTFMIGGADGFTDEIRKKAQATLCFGKQTWPHMMVRVMLMEQIYRAQQILAGHPYHREG